MKLRKLELSFLFRRIQSLAGLLFVFFLVEHLLTNFSAVIKNGSFFVKIVNYFHLFPFLKTVEISMIGIPIFMHIIFGIKYITSTENTIKKKDGIKPFLNYKRNKAYLFQRATAFLLIFFIIFHVIQMRFINYPKSININAQKYFFVKISADRVSLNLLNKLEAKTYSKKDFIHDNNLLNSLGFDLKKGQLIAQSDKMGKAFLLVVKNQLKNPIWAIFYLTFVLIAIFHAINGFWTFLITWGVIISNKAQRTALRVCFSFMLIAIFIALAAFLDIFIF